MKQNYPEIRLGVVLSSRNNFSEKLSQDAADGLKSLLEQEGFFCAVCPVLVEREEQIPEILEYLKTERCNALAIVLGNFGAETPETILAQRFEGPVMYAGITEDSNARMYDARRDSYCGLLNCSYNLGIRRVKAWIPRYPIQTLSGLVENFRKFVRIAGAIVGLSQLKLITFGPRPDDFVACNAPIQGLYDLGVAIQENSELDLYLAYQKHENDPRIPEIVQDMIRELGEARYTETLPRMAQYEVTLLDWMKDNLGERRYAAFANKCWPAFQQVFGFLPCYVHSRLAGQGIPVACETDVYGALSEYIGLCIGQKPVTLMDINNAIPDDIYQDIRQDGFPYRQGELFMAFHCGNTSSGCLVNPKLKYKINRKNPYAPETGKENNRGTLEGQMISGKMTMFRLHSDPDGRLKAYVANGEILPAEVNTYGDYGIFAVKEMERFYRYVLVEQHFPHHAAILFENQAEAVFEVLRYLGITSIAYNQPQSLPYAAENPFYDHEG